MSRARVSPRFKLFAAPAGQPRARRGTDVVLLVVALTGVLLALVVGLTSAGLPAETSLAAALLYRFVTFYLPPPWGFFALQWLQRNRYL